MGARILDSAAPRVIDGEVKRLKTRITAQEKLLKAGRKVADTFGARKRRLWQDYQRKFERAMQLNRRAHTRRRPEDIAAAAAALE